MKKMKRNVLILLACATLLLTFSVSSTVAYLVDATGSVENQFKPGKVTTDIDEIIDDNKKTSITISNNENGTVPVYVRVLLVANYVDGNNNIVGAAAVPSFTLNGEYWDLGSDGYYYHKAPVAVGDSSKNLIKEGSGITLDKDANGNAMQVIVIHQAIQADPVSTVVTVWGVTPTEVKDGEGNFLYYAISK